METIEVGARVVVYVDNKPVADGVLEAIDGRPGEMFVFGQECIQGLAVVGRGSSSTRLW